MNEQGMISVIMPVFGVEAYIARAIESVQSQTYRNWELIVVNDGTKDRSREIAKQFEGQDHRIRIYDKENGGLSDARNFGMQFVTGEYVHFFDSDDYIEPDYYSVLIAEMERQPADFLISGYTLDIESGGTKREELRPCQDGGFPNLDTGIEYLHFIATYLNFAWNKLYRASFLKNNSLQFSKGLYRIEDAEFMSRVLGFTPDFRFIRNTGYHYVIRESISLSRLYDSKITEHATQSLDVYTEILHFLNISNLKKEAILSNHALNLYKYIFSNLFQYSGNLTKAQRYKELTEVFRYDKLIRQIHLKHYKSLMDKLLGLIIHLRGVLAIYLYYSRRSHSLKKTYE